MGVIVVALARQHLARVSGAVEDILVQAFIPQLIIEAFDEPVLLGLARRDVTADSAHVRSCAKADYGLDLMKGAAHYLVIVWLE